jgi:hypothetical protein
VPTRADWLRDRPSVTVLRRPDQPSDSNWLRVTVAAEVTKPPLMTVLGSMPRLRR